jgi:MFS transporter, Spinster family, sphingosine-1-phosphate transporter
MNRQIIAGAKPVATARTLTPFWTLFILTGLNLFNYLDRFVLSAVLPSLQKDLNINDGDAGRIATAFMIGYFATSPFFGYLGDRGPRKWLIAAGIFVWSFGTVLTGFAGSLGMLLAYRVLVGVGEASYATISPSYISDTFGRARRNNALTIFYVAIPVGAALGNIVGGLISASYGWRNAFIWAGAPGLVLALLLLPFAEPKRGGSDNEGEAVGQAKKPTVKDVLNLFRIPDYVLVVGGLTAYTFALGGFAHWGPTFLHRVHQVAEKSAATFFGAVLVVAGLVGTMVGGFAATAWQKRNGVGYAWTLGLSVLAAVPVTLAAFLASNRGIAMACLATAMFLLFLSTGPSNTLIIEAVPVNLRSSAMAASIFSIHLFGDMWSPEIVGRLSDSWGSLQKAVLILPVALLICAILWLALAIRTVKRNAVPSV